VRFRAVGLPADGESQVVNGHALAFGFLKLWRSAPSRFGVPVSEMIAIEGTDDRPPEKRPVLQEFNGGREGPGLMVWRPFDGAVLWIPLP
jgi:hypothetical protein